MKSLMKVVAAVAVVCGFACSALADWTYTGSILSNEVGWVFNVSTASTVDGVRRINVNSRNAANAPTSGVLNFQEPITWAETDAYTNVVIVLFAKDLFYNGGESITELYLPLTVESLNEYCFRSLSNVTVIEPFIPDSVTSLNSPFCGASKFRGALVLGGGGKNLTMKGGADAFNRSMLTSITFGTGTMSIPWQHFYGCGNCTNITFLGDNVTWNSNAFEAWGNYQALIKVPASSAWWANFMKTDSTFVAWENLGNNQNNYWTKFDPEKKGEPPLGAVKLGSGAAMQYITTFKVETTTKDILVHGDPVLCGEVEPAYGDHADVGDAPVVFSAPEYAGLDGIYYRNLGYVVETMGDHGWVDPVTNLGVRAFNYSAVVGQQRITWLWEIVGYAVSGEPSFVEGYDLGRVDYSTMEYPGHYATGSTAVLTAVPADASDAPFERWVGADVPEGREFDNPISVTADRVKHVYPYFRKKWTCANSRFCDGYWSFGYSGNPKVTVGSGKYALWSGGYLDLAKPIANEGMTLVGVAKDTFFSGDTSVRELTLPDTLTTLNEYCFQSCANLIRVTPFIPPSVTTINSAFNGCSKLAQDLYIGSKSTNTVSVLGSLCFRFPLPSITFGRGVHSLPSQAFYANNTLKKIYFMGDKPSGNNYLEACSARGKCIFIPKGNASWMEWLTPNLTPWDEETMRDGFAKSFPDVTKKPLGYATLAGSSQWFVTWNPIPSGMQLLLR